MTKFKSLVWIVKLQWQVSATYCIWNFAKNVFLGISPLLTAYAGAQLLTLLAQVALQTHEVATTDVYKWLIVLTAILNCGVSLVLTLSWSLLEIFQDKMELAATQLLVQKAYNLS